MAPTPCFWSGLNKDKALCTVLALSRNSVNAGTVTADCPLQEWRGWHSRHVQSGGQRPWLLSGTFLGNPLMLSTKGGLSPGVLLSFSCAGRLSQGPSVVQRGHKALCASVGSLPADEAFGRRISGGKDSYAVGIPAGPVQISSLSIIQLWDLVRLPSEPQLPDLLNGHSNRMSQDYWKRNLNSCLDSV